MPEEQKTIHTLTATEETAIPATTESLCGFRWRAPVYLLLQTGGRRSELTGLMWEEIVLDGAKPFVRFVCTRPPRDRVVPINTSVVNVLCRLKAQTLQEPGPFHGRYRAFDRNWCRIIKKTGLKNVTAHACRKTFGTRLVRAGMPLPSGCSTGRPEYSGHRRRAN